MSKEKSTGVTVTFRSPSFIHKGVKYLSKDIEAAAEAGDELALRVIAELVAKGSGVIKVLEEDAEGKTDLNQSEPKPPKSRRAPKGSAKGNGGLK